MSHRFHSRISQQTQTDGHNVWLTLVSKAIHSYLGTGDYLQTVPREGMGSLPNSTSVTSDVASEECSHLYHRCGIRTGNLSNPSVLHPN